MIIDEVNKAVTVATGELEKIKFRMQDMISVVYKIAREDYQSEIVETEMQDLEEMSREDWIQDRYDYYMSEEFLND